MMIFSTYIILLSLLLNQTEESIFSSLIRNNLNRYLKNPLFTKSFVRNSIWQGELDDGHGGSYSLSMIGAQPPGSPGSSLIPREPSILEPYRPFSTFEMNDNLDISPPSATIKLPIPPPKVSLENNLQFQKDKEDKNSKSMVITTTNVNAYSDSRRINSINNNKNSQLPKTSNLYVKDESLSFAESSNRVRFPGQNQNSKKSNHHHHHHHNGGKYNQEKALNLKLEYGFKPLPSSTSSSSTRKDIPPSSSNSINDLNDYIDEIAGKDSVPTNERNENLYQSLLYNRTMKSMIDNTNNGGNNHLDEFFGPDYKKYISYPMETESSDNVHKLAFTGVESFRPDHLTSYIGYDNRNYGLLFDSISNYPNIKNFKKQGIECARQQQGYCEYDSSYPIDYINSIITNCTAIIDDMYIEMPENMNDFSGYKTLFQVGPSLTNGGQQNKNSTTSLCESERKYIRPSVIKDIHDEYHLILQSSFYFQQVPVEICTKPGQSCNFVGRCNSKVKCTQKYRTHLLISIDHMESDYFQEIYSSTQQGTNSKITATSCPKMRMYRLPSACVCELFHE